MLPTKSFLALLLFLVLLSSASSCFVNAEESIAQLKSRVHYYPRTIPINELRSRAIPITFVFPPPPNCGSMCLETTAVAGRFWNRWVTLKASVDSIEREQPYGWSSNQDTVCPYAGTDCIIQGNASNIVEMKWKPAPDYDLYFPETITVTFSARLLPNLVATSIDFPLVIEPETLSSNPMAYVLSIVAVSVHMTTIAMFPFALDTAGFLLSTSPSCTRSDARMWLPLATFGAMPLGGETFGAKLWRVGAFLAVAGLALGAWMTISGTRATDMASARLQATVPLLCAQLALYLLPGVAFASGALISKADPLLQVVGVSLVAILVLVMLSVHSWVFRRSTWRYVPTPIPPPPSEDELTWREVLEKEVMQTGFWLDSKEGEEQLNASILPRDARGGDGLTNMQAAFWVLNILTYTVSGLTAGDVFACILQRTASAMLWIVTAVFVSKIQPFRAGFLNKCATGIRVLTAFGIAVQGISPGLDKTIIFFLAICFAIPLGIVRIVIAFKGFLARTKDAVRQQLEIDKSEVDRMLKQRELELEKARREEEAAARALEARMESKRRRELRRRGPTLVELGVGGDPQEFAQTEMDESENKSGSEMTVDAINQQGQEPKYIREASRIKPLSVKNAAATAAATAAAGGTVVTSIGTNEKMWFPKERPNARTTGDGDLPLYNRPYEVRKHDEDYYYDDDEDDGDNDEEMDRMISRGIAHSKSDHEML